MSKEYKEFLDHLYESVRKCNSLKDKLNKDGKFSHHIKVLRGYMFAVNKLNMSIIKDIEENN